MARPQPQPSKTKTHKASDALQVERLHKGYAQSMEITKVLADEKSKYQHIRIFVDLVRRNFAADDLAEDVGGVVGGHEAAPISASGS